LSSKPLKLTIIVSTIIIINKIFIIVNLNL